MSAVVVVVGSGGTVVGITVVAGSGIVVGTGPAVAIDVDAAVGRSEVERAPTTTIVRNATVSLWGIGTRGSKRFESGSYWAHRTIR